MTNVAESRLEISSDHFSIGVSGDRYDSEDSLPRILSQIPTIDDFMHYAEILKTIPREYLNLIIQIKQKLYDFPFKSPPTTLPEIHLINSNLEPIDKIFTNDNLDLQELLIDSSQPDTVAIERNVLMSIEIEPVEDGFDHPVEDIIRGFLEQNKDQCVTWLNSFITEKTNSSIIAQIIKCVGRLEPNEVKDWGIDLTQKTIKHPNLEIRDATVQALELWRSVEAFQLLKNHFDEVAWLQDYIQTVLAEWE